MIRLFTEYVRAKTAEFKVKAAANEQLLENLEEAAEIVTERPGGRGWDLLGRQEKGHVEGDQKTMIAQARKFYRFDPNGRAAIMNALKYIMGKGVTITPKSKDPKVWHIWREFWTAPRNKMRLRQFEIVLRALRDGNCLIEYFQQDENGKKTWKTTVRFRDPLLLQKPTIEYVGTLAQGSNGIEVDPNDIETPTKFWFKKPEDHTSFEGVPAERIQHIKLFADSDQKIGESFLQPVMEMFTHYKQWLQNRIVLNKVRTAVALIKKINGGSADVSRIAATLPTSGNQRGNEEKVQSIRGGGMYVANQGVEYQMLSPNINAADAAEDGRNMKLNMAAGTGQPEYAFGDASNANFASTLVAESPFVKEIQFMQQVFEFHLLEMYRRVIQGAVAAGVLEEPKDEILAKIEGKGGDLEEAEDPTEKDPTEIKGKPAKKAKPGANDEDLPPEMYQETELEKFYGCDIQWPEIIHRDMESTTKAVIMQRDAGLVSDPTAAAVLGYEYDEEVRKQQKVKKNAESGENPFIQPSLMDPLDPKGDRETEQEIDDIMKTLTPEEKAKVEKMDDGQVAAFLKARAGKNGKQPAGAR